MGSVTFLQWLRNQLAKEGVEVFYEQDFENYVDEMTNHRLLQYFSDYQQETL